MSGPLTIRPADGRAGRKRFVQLPYRLYADDPNWVPPLRSAEAKRFAGKSAFFEHAEMGLFLADRGGETVGRVAAIHNRPHNDYYGDRMGFFGFFECRPDDTDAAVGLVRAAEAWLAERGLEAIRGPVNPSMNAECGLLIDGFDTQPYALMPYNPPGYPDLLAAAGLEKCKDLFGYMVHSDRSRPGTKPRKRMDRIAAAMHKRHPEITFRTLDMKRYEQEVIDFLGVFEEARTPNWGYVPVSQDEVLETAREMKRIIDPEIITLAEVDGKAVGACLAIPNVNRGLAAAKGRMFPFGFLRFLRAMKGLNEMRIFGFAAIEKYRHKGIAAMLLLETIIHGLARGYKFGEAAWILEDNLKSISTIANALEADLWKTYRIYEKPIEASGG